MITHPRKRWIPRGQADEQLVSRLAQAFGISPLVAQVLVLRNVTTESEADLFLKGGLNRLPDPFQMKGMDKAVSRIIEAMASGQSIGITGDFDSDGQTGTALLVQFFRMVKCPVEFFIPHRENDGYGISADALRDFANRGIQVVISVDCGISAIEEARVARELGISLCVTDHHQPPEQLPEAYAIINPHQPGCTFPFKDLAGVGVAFYLAAGIRKALRVRGWFEGREQPDIRELLDLAAIGTIADLVPLHGLNRLLVQAGLKKIEENGRIGLAALRDVAGIEKVSCGTIAFGVGPRINAVGRLEDATLGVQLMLCDNPDEARRIATHMNDLNRERQDIEKAMLEKAVARIEAGEVGERTIVLDSEDFVAGVQGIVASNIVELYHRPTVMISLKDGIGKASARSISGFHLFESLGCCEYLLEKYGGHAGAAGLSIREENIPEFARVFDELAIAGLSEQDMVPKLKYDSEVDLGLLDLSLVDSLQKLAPFGMGCPSPAFVCRGATCHDVQVIGKQKNHLRFKAGFGQGTIQAIAFGMAEAAEGLEGSRVDLLFAPSVNEWRGNRTVQLEIKDMRRSDG